MILFLYSIAIYILKIITYLFILAVSLLILARVWLEPIKGKCKCKTQLHGKVALVTGGNSGIGLETARDLARRGARVIIACRDAKKSEEAIKDIVQTTGNPNVEFRYLDLFRPESIRKFVADFNESVDRLDILVNNAGSLGNKPLLAENGVDIVMQVNYIGPFLLTNLLMDKIAASKPSRIVIVSSKLQYLAKLDVKDLSCAQTDSKLLKYCNSKLCNVLWTKALAKRLPVGVTVNALHPGLVKTDIFKRLGIFAKLLDVIIRILFKTVEEGAQTTIHLCVAPELENCSGGYYSDCKLKDFYKIAQDDELAENVFMESLRLSEKKI